MHHPALRSLLYLLVTAALALVTAPTPAAAGEEATCDCEEGDAPAPGPEGRARYLGVGTGLMWLPRGVGDGGTLETVRLTSGKVTMLTQRLALQRSREFTVHDLETVRAIYRWYFSGTPEQAMLRSVALFPGLVLAPMAGAHATRGPGLRLYTAGGWPVAYLATGVRGGLFIRPSEEEMLADITGGIWSELGAEVSRHLAMSARASCDLPLIMRYHSRGGELLSGGVSLSFIGW